MFETWVCIGCGGTFWCLIPYLQVLVRRYAPKKLVFVDPDVITPSNLNRQWADGGDGDGEYEGVSKVTLAQSRFFRLCHRLVIPHRATSQGIATLKEEEIGSALVICNPDNHQARLAVREWCYNRSFKYPTAMVCSGCSGTSGQAYWGYYDKGAWHDWLELHEDVKGDQTEDRRNEVCGGQTIFSNVQTAALVGQCIDQVLDTVGQGSKPSTVREYCWERSKSGGLFVNSLEVVPTSLEEVEV